MSGHEETKTIPSKYIDFFVRILYNFYEQKSQEVFDLQMSEMISGLLKQNNGVIKARDAKRSGISNKELQRLTNAGVLERVAFGLYISSDQFPDEYLITQYRCPKGVFSHETALYFHHLSDRTPLKLTLIIPTGYNTKLLKNKDNYQFYYCKKEIHELGVITVKSPFGNDIRIYDKERTICDCLKKKAVLDEDMVLSAVKQYLRETGNDYAKLLNYAEILKIRGTVKQYMEVLI